MSFSVLSAGSVNRDGRKEHITCRIVYNLLYDIFWRLMCFLVPVMS